MCEGADSNLYQLGAGNKIERAIIQLKLFESRATTSLWTRAGALVFGQRPQAITRLRALGPERLGQNAWV